MATPVFTLVPNWWANRQQQARGEALDAQLVASDERAGRLPPIERRRAGENQPIIAHMQAVNPALANQQDNAVGDMRLLAGAAINFNASIGVFVGGSRFGFDAAVRQWRNSATGRFANVQEAAAVGRASQNLALLQQSGALRSLAMRTHSLVAGRALQNSTIAVAEVRLANGTREFWAAASSRGLEGPQRALLESYGIRTVRGTEHAELNIIHNLPSGARVQRWGISRSTGQTNIVCPDCTPHVARVGGTIE